VLRLVLRLVYASCACQQNHPPQIQPPLLRCVLFQVFEAAPQEARGVPAKKAAPDYFL
jgi:hypothetical protein